MSNLDPKAQWPGWETVRLIGQGSFGAVYEIQRDVLGKKESAALKVITIPQSESDIDELYGNGFDDESITAHYKSYLEDIVREYSLMSEMKGHTNVVYCDDVKYVQHDDGFGWDIFIKMELLTPLMKALGQDVTEAQILRVGEDLCKALILCESRNILHRDIKPQNVFVSRDGDYKLGDFGIAKTAEKTSGGTKIGTYNYMAPEVYNNQPYGNAADIYSLGLVLYWLLNERRLPFVPLPPAVPRTSDVEQSRLRRFQGEPLPAPVNGSGELKRIVLKACAYDPRNRYQTAGEMFSDLQALEAVERFARQEQPQGIAEDVVTMGLLDPSPEDWDESQEDSRTVSVSGRRRASGSEPRNRTCPQCGSEVPAQNKFCICCGYNFSLPAPEPEPVPIAAPPEQPPAKPKKRGWIFGVLGGVVVAAAVLILALRPWAPGEGGEEDPDPTPRRTARAEVHLPDPEDPEEPEETPEVTEPTEAPQVPQTEALSFSAWVDADSVSSRINSENYVVLTRTEYRSRPIQVYHLKSKIPEDMTIITEELLEKGLLPEDAVIDEEYHAVVTRSWHTGNAPEGVSRTDQDAYSASSTQVNNPVWVEDYVDVYSQGRLVASLPNGGHYEDHYETQTTVQYRDLDYYCVKSDGSDWSDYSDQAELPAEDQLIDLESRVLCCYAEKNGVVRPAGMGNFPTRINNYALRFTDMRDAADWMIAPVGAVAQLGAMVPDAALRFHPSENVTVREVIEAAVVLHRIYRGEQGVLWGQSAVDYAIENGLIDAKTFSDYDQAATRADTVYILWHVLPDTELQQKTTVQEITDLSQRTGDYECVKQLAEAGVISWPQPVGEFRPNDSVTRAEAAAFLSRLAYPEMRAS